MAIPTCYSTFLSESLQKQQKILPKCRSLKTEDICGAVSAAIFFVSWYIHIYMVTDSTLCPDGALIYGYLQMKGLVYTQYGKIICSLCPPWMGWPQ